MQSEKRMKSNGYEKKRPKTNEISLDEDVFMFDSLSLPSEDLPKAKVAAKQSADSLALPLLIGGVLLLTLGLCVWMVVYGIRAKKRSVSFYL